MIGKANIVGTVSAIAMLSAVSAANGGAVRPGFDSNTFAPNDDDSTGLVEIGFTINFFGVVTDQLYVNNNGNITLDSPLEEYTPFDLTSTGQEIIAPFFADVDTRLAGDPVTYGQGTVGGNDAFGVNWLNVDYFDSDPSHTNRNSFQLVLIDQGGGDFDIEFNFDQIQWEAGEASGSDADGLGGDSARVGFSNGSGDPGTFFELDGSAVNGAFLDTGPAGTALILNSRESTVPGRYLFFARNGGISIVFGDDGGIMAAEMAIAGTKAQTEDLRQRVRANHDARRDVTSGASSMLMTSNGMSTSNFSVWAKIGGGVMDGNFGGDLDVSHFVGQAGIEMELGSGLAAGIGVGGMMSTAKTSMDKLEGDAVFVQPYFAYLNGPLTAVASFGYTYTDYDDTMDNIDSGDRFTGSLSMSYDVSAIEDVTMAPFGYLAGGTEKFDAAGGDDDQDFFIGRAGLEVSRDTVLPSTGSLNVFAAFGPEYVSANTATSAGPLTLTDYDDDRLGGFAEIGFEFTVAGTDSRLFASATGSGLFTDAPGINGQVGLSIPF